MLARDRQRDGHSENIISFAVILHIACRSIKRLTLMMMMVVVVVMMTMMI